jgi:hypothetical protein
MNQWQTLLQIASSIQLIGENVALIWEVLCTISICHYQ